jgi:uncharacterized protein
MTLLPTSQRAVVLSAFDLPAAYQLLTRSCEDCACAVSTDLQALKWISLPDHPTNNAGHWVRGRDVVDIALDDDHRVLFNPLGRGGAVVVNEIAWQILQCFQQPSTFAEALAQWSGSPGEFEPTAERFAQLQMIHLTDQPQRPHFESDQLLTAWLHVTNACNLRCPYCYLNKTNECMNETTGRAAIDAIVRSAIDHGFRAVKLKFAGGEVILNHRLVLNLHDYAQRLTAQHRLDLHSVILSNGVVFPAKLVQALKARQIRVMISLDGVGQYHDVQRPFVNGASSFERVQRTIDRLIGTDYPPHLSITVTQRNLGGLPEVVRYVLERNLTFSLNLFRENECAASFGDLQYAEQAMIAAFQQAFTVIEEQLPPWSVLGVVLDRGQLLQPRLRSCGVGHDYIVVNQRGEVAKCHMEIEQTLGDVFRSDPLMLIRQDLSGIQNVLVEEKEGCRQCTWRYWCTGGCAVATFRATGRYDIQSPNCNIYKALYPAALRLEGLRLLKYAQIEN